MVFARSFLIKIPQLRIPVNGMGESFPESFAQRASDSVSLRSLRPPIRGFESSQETPVGSGGVKAYVLSLERFE